MSRPSSARTALLLAACLLALGGGRAKAEEDHAAARKAAEALRATLPEPTPAISIEYRGDLLVDGLWSGEVDITARAAKVGRQSVWRTTQSVFIDTGVTGEVRIVTRLHLARDLSILSGTFDFASNTETMSVVMSRVEKGFVIQRRRKQGDDWEAPELLELAAPPRATAGLAAALLLLRAAPVEKGGVYALPWVGNQAWAMRGPPRTDEPFVLEVAGPGRFESPSKKRESWVVGSRHGSEDPRMLHLAPDRRSLIGMIGRKATKQLLVPRGEGGSRDVDVKGDEAAKTWKAAFLKFGYGYHMAQPEVLAVAFHWDRMYAHETEVLKRWPAEKPLEEFKQAWIGEFVANSKRRTLEDTKRLLAMTLATGKVVKETADAVVFAAHPNFGGGVQRTYHLEKRDGVWAIVRIDF